MPYNFHSFLCYVDVLLREIMGMKITFEPRLQNAPQTALLIQSKISFSPVTFPLSISVIRHKYVFIYADFYNVKLIADGMSWFLIPQLF